VNERDDRTDLALRRLGTSAVPLESQDKVAARRARLLPALSAFADEEMARAAERPRLRRAAAALAVAALLGGGALFFGSRHSPREATVEAKRGTVRVVHRGAVSDVTADLPRALSEADLLETLDGTAEVNLVTGAVVDLSAQSRLELSAVERTTGAVSERVRVSSGKVSVHVPKLTAGSKLSVATPDAVVTVHGTAFTVEVTHALDGTAATTVMVTDGRVAVDSGGREIFLDPGSRWTSATRPESVPPSTSAALVPTVDTAKETPAPGFSGAHRSTLRAENELFRAAMAADKDGKPDQVIALTDRLLRSYPDTPLAAEARALAVAARRKRATSVHP
jgi:hypothetical protein